MTTLWKVGFVSLALALPAAHAQIGSSPQVAWTVGAPSPSGDATFAAAFENVRVEGGTIGFAVRWSDAAQLSLDLSTNRTFGPIGNVVLTAYGAVRTSGEAEASLTLRGTAGPVALRLEASAYGAEAWRFRESAIASDARPGWDRRGVGVRLVATGRLARTVVLEAEPEVHVTGVGTGWRATARLRLLRAWGENELRVLARGSLAPGGAAAEGALGVGAVFPRGRAPDWTVAVYGGASSAGIRPGLTLDVADTLPGGARWDLAAAYEPYRLDVDSLRLAAGIDTPFGGALPGLEEARLVLAASASYAPLRGSPRWSVTTTLRWPFDPH